MPDALVRSCRPDEVGAVLALWEAADAPESTGADRQGLETALARDPAALLVAELDGTVVGTIIVGFDGWRGNLYRLAVLPEHRRAGIARTLVEAAERRLRSFGARRCGAIVLRENTAAVAFWEAVGYPRQHEVGRHVRTFV